MLFLDGVYVGEAASSTRFRLVKEPTSDELTQLTHTIAHRLARYLERQELLVRDADGAPATGIVTSFSLHAGVAASIRFISNKFLCQLFLLP